MREEEDEEDEGRCGRMNERGGGDEGMKEMKQ